MKLPNITILDEKHKILHQVSKEVTFPVSAEDRKLAEDTIKYLEMSQDDKIAEKYNSFFMKVPDGQQFEKTTQPGGNKCL